jgi:vacuolar-type H+-ATPase subunit D/Vma8
MTTDHATPEPPPHPLPALTTYELARYRRELDHALDVLPVLVPARALLQQRLAEVVAEQDSRATITSKPR